MKCCINCFADTAIQEKIQRDGSIERCGYCNTASAIAVEPTILNNLFDLLTDCIKEDEENGVSAAELFDDEFRLFNPAVADKNRLLADILGEGFADKRFSLIYNTNQFKEAWPLFKKELIHNNRFFPQHELFSKVFINDNSHESNTFISLIGDLGVTRYAGEVFYRARMTEENLPADKMGMPPAKRASAGRANPQGIAYLYLADNENTCIQEVRPSNGAIINISAFTATRELTLIDLTAPKQQVSLLKYEEDEIDLILQLMNWLELLSKELSKPVLPEKSHLDYIPTQFVCEYIKAVTNSDGIIFASSYGSGNNLVLFNSGDFQVEAPVMHQVNSIAIESNTIEQN